MTKLTDAPIAAPVPSSMTDESLPELLARAARTRSDATLVALLVCGLAGALAIVVLLPGAMFLAAASSAMAAFGAWGICDREREDRRVTSPEASTRLLDMAAVAVALVGYASAAVAGLELLHDVLGTWIS